MFMESHDGKHTWDVDARPSDSINFALRFGAPLYVHSTIAAKMALANGGSFTLAQSSGLLAESESQQAIIESCRAECALHSDPLVVERMRMDLAVAQERFQDAIECAPAAVVPTCAQLRLACSARSNLHVTCAV